MNFLPLLNPSLLYFLPLAAIPVILHLFTLHRVKTVDLSTYRFLFDSYIQQRRRLKFVEAIIAILRTLFLVLLVVMLARPAIQHWQSLFGRASGHEVVLLLDTSVSMNTTAAGKSALDRAKSVALAIVEKLGSDDRLTLYRIGARPEEVFSRFAADSTAIRDRIEGLKAGSSRANMLAAFTQIFGPQAPPREKPTVYLLTDSQASGWKELKQQPVEQLLPKESRFLVVNCGSSDPLPNRALIGDAPRQVRSIVGLPVRLRPRVVNHSLSESVDVVISVQIAGKEVARPSLLLKPGETAFKEVIYVPTEPGVVEGRFELERPQGGLEDGFPDDDSYLFTLQVAAPMKVLVVNGAPSNDPFETETLFLRTALTAPDDKSDGTAVPGQMSPPAPAPGQATPAVVRNDFVRSLDLQEIGEGALNEEVLRDAGVVVLANCGLLNGNQFAFLRNFITAGGGLLIFPGDKVNPDSYNQQFFALPNVTDRRFIPIDFGPPVGDVNDSQQAQRFASESLDFAHPVLSVFDTPQSRYLTNARFYRRVAVKVPPADSDRRNFWTLATFSDGQPALIESWFGEGRMLIAAFPASSKWSNLPLKPEFVPLLLRMVAHVEHRPGLESPSVVPPVGKAELGVAKDWEPVRGSVTDPAGHTTPLEFRQSGSRWLTAVEQTTEKGYYRVDVRGGGNDEGKVGTAAFAVNLSPEESNFERMNADQVRALFPDTAVEFFDASAEAQQEFGRVGGDDLEIWRPLILLMFAVIGIEFLLATGGGQRPDTGDDPTVAERVQSLNPADWVGRMTGAPAPGDPSA